MITATAIASIGVFIGAFWGLGIAKVGAGVLSTAGGAVAAMRDESLDDQAREKAVRRASIQLISAFISILIRSALTFVASFLPIWRADFMDLATTEDVVRFLSRWDVIMIATIVVIAGYVIWMRRWPSR